ncbi:MAG: enoyl-CoA hydratase-related protein, partial [Bacilli bacterium]
DPDIHCVIIMGSEKVFAAGADIYEMNEISASDMYLRNQFVPWDRLKKIRKPLIAAVHGYALGGGCELAMSCDMIYASETAKFGQPEINLGVIPGAGGTQRLTKAIGKSMAMEMVLTGKMLTAKEALHYGLVSKVVPNALLLDEAFKLGDLIASKPLVALQLGKESVLKSFDLNLTEGLEFERKNFTFLFATEDQKEGMHAFIEKRPALFKGR